LAAKSLNRLFVFNCEVSLVALQKHLSLLQRKLLAALAMRFTITPGFQPGAMDIQTLRVWIPTEIGYRGAAPFGWNEGLFNYYKYYRAAGPPNPTTFYHPRSILHLPSPIFPYCRRDAAVLSI